MFDLRGRMYSGSLNVLKGYEVIEGNFPSSLRFRVRGRDTVSLHHMHRISPEIPCICHQHCKIKL